MQYSKNLAHVLYQNSKHKSLFKSVIIFQSNNRERERRERERVGRISALF